MDALGNYMGLIKPDNDHWRSVNATPVIDNNATVAQAADVMLLSSEIADAAC